MKRLEWKKFEDTGDFAAFNVENDCVGYLSLKRIGAHMHWLWYQTEGFHMSPGCLQEVRDKQKELFKQRKNESNNT